MRGRVAGLVLAAAFAAPAQDWPDTFVGRVELLALEQTIHARVLASSSATLTLEAWCREHQLAAHPAIVAERVDRIVKPPTAEQRARLQVSADQEVRLRHVRLRCGERVLSEADNWYVPARLTADMNRALETTDAPFGKVVQPLGPTRQTFEGKVLWAPLPDGWERGPVPPTGTGSVAIPDALFEHRAILYTRDRLPFSEVDEVYRRELLAFPPPVSPARRRESGR